jgi:mono/diheme cytochrome c family protein
VLYRAGLIALLLQAVAAPAQERFTASESRGRLIYTSGQSVAGQPLSYRILGAGDDVLLAKGVYCATCHGLDGKGGREGRSVAPDITPTALAKRNPAPYTEDLLARAITEGVDSSGRRLGPLMPRWALSESELEDLLAYMKRLGGLELKNRK